MAADLALVRDHHPDAGTDAAQQVALAYLDDEAAMVDAARAVSELTHFDPLAGDACVLCAVCCVGPKFVTTQPLPGRKKSPTRKNLPKNQVVDYSRQAFAARKESAHRSLRVLKTDFQRSSKELIDVLLQGIALLLVGVGFTGALVVNSVLFKAKKPVESSMAINSGNVTTTTPVTPTD